jgi:hypothetical protein
MAIKSQLAGLVARQVGALQGKLTAQVQDRVLETVARFANQCPPDRELRKIIRTRDNLLKAINGLEKRLNTFKSLANKLGPAITAAKIAIKTITAIPRPTVLQFVPDPGALVKGVPFSALTKLSDRLIFLNKLLDSLEGDKEGILGVISSVSTTIASLKQRLSILDNAIEACSKKSPDLPGIVKQVQPKANTGSEGTPTNELGNIDPRYEHKGYILAIIEDPNSPAIAPRRYAVAKDNKGTVVLRGQSSFSSDTQILLDEIKFRIDNQLP